ncbi:MAG: [protein-PII] uridylyltransferase [Acidobacteria bacterium]|nr:[protein-PII] uridylyltransferase [Acidobacteriota bacterium]
MNDLLTFHAQSMERINSAFFERGDGVAATRDRSETVDQIVTGLFERLWPAALRDGCAVLAVGGYGRSELFPYSDVDLLFLFDKESTADKGKEALAQLLTALWDAQLRVSQSVRTVSELMRLADGNAELHISLLDLRFLAGDRVVFEELASRNLPKFFVRERKSLIRNLIQLAEERRREFGDTIYHLEPDIKEGPGGLRDLQLACWVGQLAHIDSERIPACGEHIPAELRPGLEEARPFLFALRCYLHYFSGRDSNRLAFDLQETIAHDGSGKAFREVSSAADWMRDYFRHVRSIRRLAQRVIDENATSRASLFSLLRNRRSSLSNRDFSVTHGRIFLRYSQAIESDPEIVLRLFRFVARHGIPPAPATERLLTDGLEGFRSWIAAGGNHWPLIAEILVQPHAYDALSAMHDAGALYALFPELEAIDCLVIRDFYHRYTVDEHTLLAIRTLHQLGQETDEMTARFARLYNEIESPANLHLALLYHDVGKAFSEAEHVTESGKAVAGAMQRMGLDARDQRQVRFLVEQHLVMSHFLTKRDISDPETIEEFVGIVGTIENLRALTLLTYADTSAVNPRAMTDWRKELLWQLYLSAFNRLTGETGDRRIGGKAAAPVLAQVADPDERAGVASFLEGFPERYLRTHSPDQVITHYRLSRQLDERVAAAEVERRESLYEVTVLTWDRPFLFASLCAAMAGFGLNIERAEAFSNAQGLVLDTFTVTLTDGRAAELDEHDRRQLARTLRRVVEGREDVQKMLGRRRRFLGSRGRTPLEPDVSCDNETSSRATIFHVIAEDRTGLLYDLTSAFSRNGCSIEVVLSETQGRRAIDVFYVVAEGRKLSPEEAQQVLSDLRGACRSKAA